MIAFAGDKLSGLAVPGQSVRKETQQQTGNGKPRELRTSQSMGLFSVASVQLIYVRQFLTLYFFIVSVWELNAERI